MSYVVNVHYGSTEIQTRFVPFEGGLEGQGRSVIRDEHGKITETTAWEATCAIRFGNPTPSRFQRLKAWAKKKVSNG